MNDFEKDLRQLLGRREPPPGFADHVIGETLNADPQKSGGKWRRWAAATAVVAIMAGGFALDQARLNLREDQRIADRLTKEQLMFGLRVAGAQLRTIQERWQETQRRIIQRPINPINQ